MLATLAKALVAPEKYEGKQVLKLVGSEVRYNSELYLDAIARIQAAQGIKTLTPKERKTILLFIPMWTRMVRPSRNGKPALPIRRH